MAVERSARPLARCFQSSRHDRITLPIRALSTSASRAQDVTTEPQQPPLPPPSPSQRSTLDPNIIHSPRSERKLQRTRHINPIGSRRRRAALASGANIPFSQLPYQCFQEARRVLQEDRKEKVRDIEEQKARLGRRKAQVVHSSEGAKHETQLRSMGDKIERLKIYADINDPIVKKAFEDGQGDMRKPIYRHLSNVNWRSYKRKVLMQRVQQMTVVPDILPSIDPTVSTALSFGKRNVPHGDIVDSRVSESAPRITIQPYNAGERLVTIAVINPDVPNVGKDGFSFRCHFLAANIPVSPTTTEIDLGALLAEQMIHPWLPPFSQKGLPYQRLGVVVLQQPKSAEAPKEFTTLDVLAVKTSEKYGKRDNFILRSLVDRFKLEPVGIDLFRTKWDEGTAGVMERAGITGGDVEFKRKKIEPLPYQRLKSERYR